MEGNGGEGGETSGSARVKGCREWMLQRVCALREASHKCLTFHGPSGQQ